MSRHCGRSMLPSHSGDPKVACARCHVGGTFFLAFAVEMVEGACRSSSCLCLPCLPTVDVWSGQVLARSLSSRSTGSSGDIPADHDTTLPVWMLHQTLLFVPQTVHRPRQVKQYGLSHTSGPTNYPAIHTTRLAVTARIAGSDMLRAQQTFLLWSLRFWGHKENSQRNYGSQTARCSPCNQGRVYIEWRRQMTASYSLSCSSHVVRVRGGPPFQSLYGVSLRFFPATAGNALAQKAAQKRGPEVRVVVKVTQSPCACPSLPYQSCTLVPDQI